MGRHDVQQALEKQGARTWLFSRFMLHGASALDPNFALGGDKVPTGERAMQRVSRRCAKRLVHRRTDSKIDA